MIHALGMSLEICVVVSFTLSETSCMHGSHYIFIGIRTAVALGLGSKLGLLGYTYCNILPQTTDQL